VHLLLTLVMPNTSKSGAKTPGRVDMRLTVLVRIVSILVHGLAPTYVYLSEDCPVVALDSFCRRLRSAEVDTCLVLLTSRLGSEITVSLSRSTSHTAFPTQSC